MTQELTISNGTQIQPQRKSFFDSEPKDQVKLAAEMATSLIDIIDKQKLFSLIQGKKYVKAEGWQTLGTFLGVIPKEKYLKRLEDGSYEAYIEIVKFKDGMVVGGASAICSRSEKRWSTADDYAVRSMAVTRATGKAFRVGFSWIVTLAGYAPTNAEEMPEHEYINIEATPSKPVYVPLPPAPNKSGYQPQNKNHQDVMMKQLQARKVPEDLWDEVGNAMAGKAFDVLDSTIKSVIDRNDPTIRV